MLWRRGVVITGSLLALRRASLACNREVALVRIRSPLLERFWALLRQGVNKAAKGAGIMMDEMMDCVCCVRSRSLCVPRVCVCVV